jgi:Uma2 family endonuclease
MSTLAKNLSLEESIDEKEILKSFNSLPTEDDLPYDDGEPMETPEHRKQMNILIESLETYWGKSRSYFVGGNMFLHYNPSIKNLHRGPDFFLVLNAKEKKRKSWVVWQEGMRFPDVIVELLSDSTRKIDYTVKKELYEHVFKTGEYYLYDPISQEFTGYKLVGNYYESVSPDSENKIFSPTTNLYLIVKDDWLRWITKEGILLPTPKELAEEEHKRAEQAYQWAEKERQKAEQEHQRAEQEHQRAEQERQRAERLAAQLRKLGIEPEET